MARPLIHVPTGMRRGEIVEIRVLISHPMETGFRSGLNGAIIPRNILTGFTCHYLGDLVCRAEFSPAIAANPFFSFTLRAREPGRLTCRWIGDGGFDVTETVDFPVVDP